MQRDERVGLKGGLRAEKDFVTLTRSFPVSAFIGILVSCMLSGFEGTF